MPRCWDWASPIIRRPPPRSISCRPGSTASRRSRIILGLVGYVVWVWTQPRGVGRGPWTVTLPGGPLTLLQIAIGIVDLGFCALAMYVLVPDEPNLGFVVVAVIFVSATLLGFASHSPGGLGVFDAAMLVGLWQMDREDLLAGMLLFRVLYYIAPFVISVILLTFREVILGARLKRLRQLTPGLRRRAETRGRLCARAWRHRRLTTQRPRRVRA